MDGLLSLLLFLVLLITLIIAIMGLLNRIIFKMAARNFARRKAQSVIVIAGLMIGTAIISSSLIVGDTIGYLNEVEAYRSLGEIDEEIWGVGPTGIIYFSEDIYFTLKDNLSDVGGIESIAPVLSESCAVQDFNTEWVEPSSAILGLDSQVLRSTSFGDLDGKGFYPDTLGAGEAAINSRLADELEASVGDIIQISFGAKSLIDPEYPEFKKENLTVVKIIKEKNLYGKANYNQRSTIFLELDTVQSMFNCESEINIIWISNKGDYKEGEHFTGKVNATIRAALDDAVGMRDLGLALTLDEYGLSMTSSHWYFPLDYSGLLYETAIENGATSMTNLMIQIVALDNNPASGIFVSGYTTTDPTIPKPEKGVIYVLNMHAFNMGISNNTNITISTRGIDGVERETRFQVMILPLGIEESLPLDIRTITFGFVDFETSQLLLHGGAHPSDMASFVNIYGVDNTTLNSISQSVTKEMNDQITAEDINLEVVDHKLEWLEAAREAGDGLASLFLIFSVFSILAGVILIINIFVMLGEERKSEMGMARAVGMKRKHLIRMFLFEGVLYAYAASAVGAFLGLLFGRLLIYAFDFIFGEVADISIPFYFEWDSLLTAFCLGLLLTFVTIFFACRRISKLNIIRAIRKIPEPRGIRAMSKDLIYGGLLLFFGVIITLWAASSLQGSGWMAGPPMIFLGAALIAHKWVSIRPAITLAGLGIIAWILNPIPLPLVRDSDFSGVEIFVLSGVFLVLGGVLIVMFNSDLLLTALQRTIGRQKSTRAVLKTAISYPMDSKFKTGMTLGMFALIIFTVTVIAMIAGMQGSLTNEILDMERGGYDVIAYTNPRTPLENMSVENLSIQDVNRDRLELETISVSLVKLVDYDRKEGSVSDYSNMPATEKAEMSNILGVCESFLRNNNYELVERDEEYPTDLDAWLALKDNSSLCIIDSGRLEGSGIIYGAEPGGAYLGGTITITDLQGQNRTRNLKIIGITYQGSFLQGIFIKKQVVREEYGGVESILLMKVGDEDPDLVAKQLEKEYIDYGLQAIDMKALIETFMNIQINILHLMEGFMGIGLLVGIAGIGIISYRSVIERRQQIGMLRAIGFRKRMITKSFLIETSFITILATIIGIVLGIGIGWQIYVGEEGIKEMGGSFVIPWMNLLAIVVIAYVTTLIFTFYPSLKAAKIPPAEALRYIE